MGFECRTEFEIGRKIMEKKKCTAIILSAGQGKRMGSNVQKQYIELNGNPIIYYTIKGFQESDIIDDIILVVGEGQEEYVQTSIVDHYSFTKVKAVVVGGKERYHSVWEGLKLIRDGIVENNDGYVFIHDGARMFVDIDIIEKGYETVLEHRACAAGVPCKDTIKIVDENNCVSHTPVRKYVWAVQTPQIFKRDLVIDAYEELMSGNYSDITDDAMVVEQTMNVPVKLYFASYENIKITTPEDLEIAEKFLKKRC